jgi:hypothetical protein
MNANDTTTQLTDDEITAWVEQYLRAWKSNTTADIEALFTETAEYHERPYETDLIGRDNIVAGWQSRWEWQQGGWSFEWTIRSMAERTAVIDGVGHYKELGNFDNEWTITLDGTGRCSSFAMLNTEQD